MIHCLTDAYLKIRRVKVRPSVAVAHELPLRKGPAIYPIRRVECKSFIIPASNPTLRKENIFSGLAPKSFVFGLVDSGAYNGAYKKNPYNFENFGVTSIGISVNGEEITPTNFQVCSKQVVKQLSISLLFD